MEEAGVEEDRVRWQPKPPPPYLTLDSLILLTALFFSCSNVALCILDIDSFGNFFVVRVKFESFGKDFHLVLRVLYSTAWRM